ncbi:MAG: type II secretion system protein [Planctomycetes bacterium]|nr:type II secretion system protein [Planctomycetota bacterium]
MHRKRGFTLIELLIVCALIAIVAAIALPNLLSARLSANESAAISTMKQIVSAQSVAKTSSVIDQDTDGLGEFAWFAEMGGTINVRDNSGPNNGPLMQPNALAASLSQVNAAGMVTKSGYVYRMSLPSGGGAPISEAAGGGSPTGEIPDLCETTWCCYSWPATFSTSGRRAFVVNQDGDVLQTNNLGGAQASYSGATTIPTPDAAFESGTSGLITGELSIRAQPAVAVDGNTWLPIN